MLSVLIKAMSNQKSYHFKQSPFFRLQSKSKLANLLHLSRQKLIKVSNRSHCFYLEREIYNTEKGTHRQIETPKHIMKTIHNRIRDLMNRIAVPNYIFSPRKGVSTIQNARLHQNGAYLFKIDIKRYFTSITQQKIYNFFLFKMECSKDVAAILAKITTVSNHLPTGSSLSPIMSYHVNSDMWEDIYQRVVENNCNLSVWVDDICISGDMIPGSLIWDIKKTIFNNNFRCHKEKRYGPKDLKNVTGINFTPVKISPRNGQYKKLYKFRKQLLKVDDELSQIILISRIQGLRNYICKVEESNYVELS